MARKGSRIAGNWRFGSHAAPLLLALLLLALVVGVRGTETNASAPEAEQRDCSQIYLDMHNPFLMQPTPMKGQRSVSSNHKTGTFLIWCLQKMMHTDYRIKVTIGSQREAGAFSPLANQLNMVRNPFTLIHSAYEYHRKGMEGWSTIAALKHKDDPMLNLHPTYRVYANWCNDTKTRVNQSMSYRDMLNHLPLHQGLLMEAVRSSRTIGNMMAAAASCANIAALTQGQPGSCVNLLLDELMEDFPGSYRDYIVPALNLNLPPAAAMRFQKKCDLTNSSSKMLTSHTTEKGDKRVQAVLLIRQLDEEVLGGRLREAEELLGRLVEATKISRLRVLGGGDSTNTPTNAPTAAPTVAPTAAPTVAPAAAPTTAPIAAPTAAPTAAPSGAPTAVPTAAPTAAPTVVMGAVLGAAVGVALGAAVGAAAMYCVLTGNTV